MADPKTILLVEDEALIALSEAMMLRKEGYRVEIASSGEQAIAQVDAAPNTFDLIIMDINLGLGLDGTQAAQEILKVHDIPVLFLSSHTEPEVVEKTEKITSYGYVVKDSGSTVLCASIKMAFKLHAAHLAIRTTNENMRTEIAERKQAQEAAQLFKAIIESSAEAIAISKPSGELIYINPAHEALFGRSFEQARIANYRDYYPPESVKVIDEVIAPALERGESWEGELDVFDRNGQRFPLWERAGSIRGEKGEMLYGYGFMHDISERKQAQQALLNSREAYKGYFNMGTVGMCVTSPEAGWIEVNEHLCQMLGYTREELLHMTWTQLTHPQDLHKDVTLFQQVLNGERDSYEMDKRFIRKDGQIVYTSLYATCQRAADGSVSHFLASLVDITGRMQIEEALKRSLEEKEMLMHELQHRVKNSLMVASGLLTLEEENLADDRARSIFANTRLRLQSMAAIYEQLYHSGEINRVDLRQYLDALISNLTSSYIFDARQITIETQLEAVQLPLSKALPLGIILTELFTNAIKYAFPAQMEPREQPGVIRVELAQSGSQVCLNVVDNGVGLRGEALSGGGMGLELVKMLVRQVAGSFLIENDHGCRASVIVNLE